MKQVELGKKRISSDMTTEDIKRQFTFRDLVRQNSSLRNALSSSQMALNSLKREQEAIIEKQVNLRTEKLSNELKEKDKEIEALKKQIAKMQSIMDNDSSNSGIPTSKTAIGKQKYIPNCREKTGNKKGGQLGHKKHKLYKFEEDEVTEVVEVMAKECSKCKSKDIEKLDTSVDKDELDYEVKVIKRRYKFKNYKCQNCGNVFHVNIPNDLKEENQYGKTVQSLAICLTNEIYTPFNKTVKLVSGITDGEINMNEGYVAKLQKRASSKLVSFIEELKKHILNQPVFGWDDGVITVDKKNTILRTYCTDDVALFIAHANKNEESLKDDGILTNARKETIVMHDHILHNYSDNYKFDNVECVIHLIRRLKKSKNNTNHKWQEEMISFLSKINKDRNKLIKENINAFEKEYLEKMENDFDSIINNAQKENEHDSIKVNYFKEEELNFIKDLIKYKRNYLLWAYRFDIPSTNNNSERNIRPVKSKLKISGQFQSLQYASYYATIRSYIETCKRHGINIINACEKLMAGSPYSLEEILDYKK